MHVYVAMTSICKVSVLSVCTVSLHASVLYTLFLPYFRSSHNVQRPRRRDGEVQASQPPYFGEPDV